MSWRPIPIVGVDLDDDTVVAVSGVDAGQRVWVEVSRRGQIVAIVEMNVGVNGISIDEVRREVSKLAPSNVSSAELLSDDELPAASVVVPTINSNPERLRTAVHELLNLDYPNYDIIVVDNRPDPERTALPEFDRDGRVRTYWEPRRGVSAARNRGIVNATGAFVAFTDDDVKVDAQWLREFGTRFVTHPEIDGISGAVLPLELRTETQLWFEEFFGGFNQSFSAELLSMALLADDPLFPYSTGRFGAGCNMAMRTSALAAKGGFDVTLGVGTPSKGGEDLAMSMKQVLSGGTLAFEPRAVVRHQHRETKEAYFKQVFGYGTGLTAMFTALVVHDPRHLWRMIRRFPAGLKLLTKPSDERSPSVAPSYPKITYVYHLLGMAYGPVAYLRSVVAERRGR